MDFRLLHQQAVPGRSTARGVNLVYDTALLISLQGGWRGQLVGDGGDHHWLHALKHPCPFGGP